MKKAGDGDINIALLEYRNTPVTGTPYSPAQMLMSRVLKSKLPITDMQLVPTVVDPRAYLTRQTTAHATGMSCLH